MKVLVLGSEGFVGRNTMQAFAEEHEVYGASRSSAELPIDLADQRSIADVLTSVKPDIIFNAAGIVGASDDVMNNVTYTTNLLQQVIASGSPVKRIIISGSAAEYGRVDEKNIPVSENAPVNAVNGYALSKAEEVRTALKMAHEYSLPVVVARIFNPIGPGMHSRFLIPRVLAQIAETIDGKRETLEISRLDSMRDYLDVRDLGRAIVMLAEGEPRESVYNIGSGKSTANGELIDLLVSESKLEPRPRVEETMTEPEPLVAIQADITRLQTEFGWRPSYTLEETIKDIIHETRRQN